MSFKDFSAAHSVPAKNKSKETAEDVPAGGQPSPESSGANAPKTKDPAGSAG
jgi:hypothetical protein